MTKTVKSIPYLLQGKNIILVIDSKSHTISKDTHMNYAKIVDALKAKDWDLLKELVEPAKAIVNFGKGFVSIKNGVVYWKDTVFNNALSQRMIEMYMDGFPIDPMIRFMENLMTNPSKRSVEQVYKFLEKNKLPITEDGYFLAFKKVRNDYLDIHSGKVSNKIGESPSMDRNLVDDNPDATCSSGLHFCSESYLAHFGSSSNPVMIVKINPADVVSIPSDYNGAKGRCCKYEVIAQVNGSPSAAFASVVDKTYSAPAPAAAVTSLNPAAAWPFASPAPAKKAATPTKKVAAPAKKLTTATSLYSVERRSNGDVMFVDLTLAEAREKVAAAVRQKKATLVVVDSTGQQV